eukprot:m.243164 g.243164  ORF g.243164 m.243164 type:complete len:344 (+) comp19443_c1_seq18:296-1327(+)
MGKSQSKLEKYLEQLPQDERYFGLSNFGQTCYMNSVLQALYFCPPFRVAVLKNCVEKSEDNLMHSLMDLFEQIRYNKKKSGVIYPRKFYNRLHKDNELFTKNTQQDAVEFMTFLLNKVSEIIHKHRQSIGQEDPKNPKNPPDPTWIEQIFEGKLQTATRCLCCESVQKRDEPFINLSIEIRQNTSITSCLRRFSDIEYLKGDSKYFCETCCGYQEAAKTMRLHVLPTVLILQLKRFMYTERLQRFTKLSYRVAYPFELRLFNTTQDAVDGGRMYDLFAVVVHMGARINSGHYIAVVKSASKWLLFDDDYVQVHGLSLNLDDEFYILYGNREKMNSRSVVCGFV